MEAHNRKSIDSIDSGITPIVAPDSMSQIEVLPAHCPIDFNISCDSPHSESFPRYKQNVTWDADTVVHDIPCTPAPRGVPEVGDHEPLIDGSIFPSLPPLHHGHREVHLRNGIMNASRLAAANEPDAEKAFFVGDLSQVYGQHQRWMSCLPEVQPYYGLSI